MVLRRFRHLAFAPPLRFLAARLLLTGLLVTGLLVTGLLVTGCDRGEHPQNLGKLAPQFSISDGTQTVDLAKLRGHIVLVNLWASWCAPCIEELPSLLALQHQMPGLIVVAISLDQDPTAYRDFLARNHVDLLTVRDPEGSVNNLYGTAQIPETYVIDRNGILRRKFVSSQNWTNPDIIAYLHRIGA